MTNRFTFEIDTSFSFPNIDIYKQFYNGSQTGWRVTPHEGYVIYDTTEENWAQDSPDSEPYPVIYYYTAAYLPIRYNFDNFTFEAVPRSEVDENYIFGGGDNSDHEIM